MQPITAVLFDLDNTLCRYPRTDAELLSVSFEEAGVEPFFAPEAYHEVIPEYIDEVEEVAELRTRCFSELARRDDRDPADGERVAAAYTANRTPESVEFVPGARDLLDELAGRYRLGLVTNGQRDTQSAKLDALGIADLFETTVYAGDDVPAKPHPKPYRVAADALGVAPENVLFVGDSLDSDVAGAEAVGMASAWVTSDSAADEGASASFVVESVAALRSLSCLSVTEGDVSR